MMLKCIENLYVYSKIHNRTKELFCDAIIFVFRFFIFYLPKKKWKLENDPRLTTIPYLIYLKLSGPIFFSNVSDSHDNFFTGF